MRYNKLVYLLINLFISIAYGVFAAGLIVVLHNSYVGIPSGVVSALIMFLALYHYLNWRVFKYYNRILNENLMTQLTTVSQFESFQNKTHSLNILVESIKVSRNFKILDRNEQYSVLVSIFNTSLLNWGTLLFFFATDSNSKKTKIEIKAICIEKDKIPVLEEQAVNEVIYRFKSADILDYSELLN